MRTQTSAHIAVGHNSEHAVAHGGHVLKRFAPKQPTKITYKKRRRANFNVVEMREAHALQAWVEDELKKCMGG